MVDRDKRIAALSEINPQMLRAKSEGDRKKLAEDLRPVIGQLVARTFQLMGISKQEAAYQMQYDDPGTVSRWCSGTERPLFDKLFAIEGFEVAYVLAIAERRHQQFEVETVIKVRRIA